MFPCNDELCGGVGGRGVGREWEGKWREGCGRHVCNYTDVDTITWPPFGRFCPIRCCCNSPTVRRWTAGVCLRECVQSHSRSTSWRAARASSDIPVQPFWSPTSLMTTVLLCSAWVFATLLRFSAYFGCGVYFELNNIFVAVFTLHSTMTEAGWTLKQLVNGDGDSIFWWLKCSPSRRRCVLVGD